MVGVITVVNKLLLIAVERRNNNTWNNVKEAKIIATLKSWAVVVYVINDSVAARTGMENANAILVRNIINGGCGKAVRIRTLPIVRSE